MNISHILYACDYHGGMAPQIHSGLTIREIMALCPGAADIMIEYGMHCFDCSVGGGETLAEAASIHHFPAETVDALLSDINDAFAAEPERPKTVTITAPAARAIGEIAVAEGRSGQGLKIVVDDAGGFCMEFQEASDDSDLRFSSPEEPDVAVFVSPLSLRRIGGATIDFRKGVFKLDLPGEDRVCCGKSETCSC